MSLCQTILLDFDSEMKAARALLERVPVSSFKPHEKSMPLDYLATHTAEIPSWFPVALEVESFHLPIDHKMDVVTSTGQLLQVFDDSVAKGRAAIDKVTDEDMGKSWTFTYGDVFSMTQPRTEVVRGFLNHFVHHRAQLGVYLRLLNVPIPGMYGASADDAAAGK